MNRWIHTVNVGLRRALLGLILMVPAGWRARLAQNPLLTRWYLYFDRAKYEPLTAPDPLPVFDAPAPETLSVPAPAPPPVGLPFDHYDYFEPEFSPAIKAELAGVDLPLFSVLMPVHNTPEAWLRLAIDSVLAQWYPNWELCIVDDCSDRPETLRLLGELDDPRIRVQRLEKSGNIVGASNAALAMAKGEFIALLDHDDELTSDALYCAWRAIRDESADFIYSDEDKLDMQGRYCSPHFKAAFSPELFLSQNYLCHLAVMRREVAMRVGGFTPGMDGAQDYDLFLKVLEHAKRIVHIPRVLYHWRMVPGSTAASFSEKSYAQQSGQMALASALKRRGLDASVEAGRYPGTYRVRYAIPGDPLVSIVVPFKDQPGLLRSCLASIIERSTYRNFEVIGVSNNSEEAETFAEMERWARRDERIRFVEHNVPFNFSEINNFAVAECVRGEHVVMLNNDVELISRDWIESLLEFSQRPDVGVVGAKLFYPDKTLQHAGIVVGLGGVAGHSHKHLGSDHPGYFFRPHLIQNLSAVTGACCMVKSSVYRALGGLDEENFKVAFNDVDFCMRVLEAGYLNVYTPYCEAWHHESISRGYEDTEEKKQRFAGEVRSFRSRHQDALEKRDAFYNPNLTRAQENFFLSANVLNREHMANPAANRNRVFET
jgi:glycosyltransferase involved in cell wall biosynthesis